MTSLLTCWLVFMHSQLQHVMLICWLRLNGSLLVIVRLLVHYLSFPRTHWKLQLVGNHCTNTYTSQVSQRHTQIHCCLSVISLLSHTPCILQSFPSGYKNMRGSLPLSSSGCWGDSASVCLSYLLFVSCWQDASPSLDVSLFFISVTCLSSCLPLH